MIVSNDNINEAALRHYAMGLIREPKNVDFTVLDKPWTEEERREFSTYIKMRKDQQKKRTKRITPHKEVVS